MLYRVVVFCAVLLAALPARALNACFVESAGWWSGPIYEGAIFRLNTQFIVKQDGTLTGSYDVQDNAPYHGILTNFHQTGPCSALFTWHDPYGAGLVRIDFAPEQGRFRGRWGAPNATPRYIFDGFRQPSQPLT